MPRPGRGVRRDPFPQVRETTRQAKLRQDAENRERLAASRIERERLKASFDEASATLEARAVGARAAAEEYEADLARSAARVQKVEEDAADKVAYMRALVRQGQDVKG